MELTKGTRIGSYEIQHLLGRGGIGTVYLAYDTKLRREIALKVLSKAGMKQRLSARFKQEALAASALNHPNILTVHDFDRINNLYYLVTEYVKGRTLRARLSEQRLSVEEALEIAVQIGEALKAAHERGIIHRDIKPENVMLTTTGLVKVLDFGLAKFSPASDFLSQGNPDSTVSVLETQPGTIIGTISYMSPEQLCQQKADVHTDVWSLGVVLFEMLAGQRPFGGNSTSEIIAAILKQPAPSLAELNSEIPSQVIEIIEKALHKVKEKRFQTAGEFVKALKNAEQFLGRNQVSYSPELQEISSRSAQNSDKSQTQKNDAVLTESSVLKPSSDYFTLRRTLLISFVSVLIGVFSLWLAGNSIFSPTKLEPKTRRVTNSGNIVKAAISPDGRFTAYVVETETGQQSLRLGQLDLLPASSQELVEASNARYGGLNFSPDGNYIYYSLFRVTSEKKEDKADTTTSYLFRITLLGRGEKAQLVSKNVDSPPTFSPDGKQFAFIRSMPKEGEEHLIVASADGSQERVLLARQRPDFLSTSDAKQSPAWSPDGEFIACPVGIIDRGSESMTVAMIRVSDGSQTNSIKRRWQRVGRIVWLKKTNDLLFTAIDADSDLYQIWHISSEKGEAQRFRDDFMDYTELNVSSDTRRLLAVESEKKSSLWLAQAPAIGRAVQLTGNRYDAFWGGTWTSDGRLIYSSLENGRRDLWSVRATDSSNRTSLTSDPETNDYPAASFDGRFIVFVSNRQTSGGNDPSVPHLWRIDSDGRNLKQLTAGAGETFPTISPDGRWIVYTGGDRAKTLWKISADGTENKQLTDILAHWASVSPDGKLIACLSKKSSVAEIELAVLSIETGEFIKTFPAPPGIIASPSIPPAVRWKPDGKSLLYVLTKAGVSNIWEQPLTGGEPKPLTDFTTDFIFWFDWSKDGKQLAFARGVVRSDLVLVEDF